MCVGLNSLALCCRSFTNSWHIIGGVETPTWLRSTWLKLLRDNNADTYPNCPVTQNK